MAPLLPKLRGHFAEFLNKGSSARLRIFFLPTCVGFGTGAKNLDSVFSWQCSIGNFSTYISIPIRTQHHPTDLPAGLAYFVGRAYLQRALRSFLRQHFSQTILYCTGISTGCPSPTPFGLSLGPDLP